jgi:hypothetical protein
MKPFLSGKTSLCTPAAKTPAAGSVAPLRAAMRAQDAPTGGNTPVIDVIKEGDKVVRLVITCACGERMEVECIYPAGS